MNAFVIIILNIQNQLQMIQYFSKSAELGPLKQIPIPKQAIKIIRISYPHNAIQKINTAISKAQNIQQIDLSYNKIITIQPLFQLRKLRVLDISNNQISNISKGIVNLKRLEKIDLTFNLLSTLNSVNYLLQLYRIRKTQLVFLLQGNKVLENCQEVINHRTNAITEEVLKIRQKIQSKSQLKQLQISKCMTNHKRANSNTVQIYPQNDKLNSPSDQVIQTVNHQILGSLSQSRKNLQVMLINFLQYERKFEVILGSQFKGWNQNLLKIYRKEAQSVKSFIQTYKNMIKCLTTQFIDASAATIKIQTYSIQASQVQQLIKDQHFSLLQALSQYQDVPVTNYKIWVQFYRQIRSIAEKVRWQACNFIQCQIRNQQIQALKLISPSKNDPNAHGRQDQLQGLLFSKNKQNKEDNTVVQCSECFVKNQQIRQLKQIVQILSNENSYLKQNKQQITKQSSKINREYQIMGKQLKLRQQVIIQQLNNKINASVYQKILLQQAKGIQDLIKCDRHYVARLKQRDNLENTQKLGDICQTATAIAKDKAIGEQKLPVSQFYSQSQERQKSKHPYFNMNMKRQYNTNDINRRSKKNTQNSTQKKKKSMNQITIKDQSSSGYSNSRSKKNLQSRKVTQKQISEYSSMKKIKKVSESSQNKKQNIIPNNFVISDFALTQMDKQKQANTQTLNNRKALAELIIKKTSQQNKRSWQQQKSNRQQNRFNNQGSKDINILTSQDKQNIEASEYQPREYLSIDLKSEQPYNKYMKYHLRNSIIQILDRKGKRYSLSKQGLNLGIKQGTVKINNKMEDRDGFSTKVKKINSATKFSARILSDRQMKLQAARLTNRYHSNSKSYVDMIGKLRN